MSAFKLSIITVAYNAEDLLPITLKSVRAVKTEQVEYLVLDGASKDGSMALLKQNMDIIDQLASEPDQGIYDAMNKALLLATGEYIVYINAGDEILPQAVEAILDASANQDIIYGDAMFVDDHRKALGLRSNFTSRNLPEALSLESFRMGQAVCHQSFVVRRSIAPSYNLNYQISADYDWMLTCIERSASNLNLNMAISNFLHGGVSKQRLQTALTERFRIMIAHYGIAITLYNHFKIVLRGIAFYGKHRRMD